jgi:hypothetical protein
MNTLLSRRIPIAIYSLLPLQQNLQVKKYMCSSLPNEDKIEFSVIAFLFGIILAMFVIYD